MMENESKELKASTENVKKWMLIMLILIAVFMAINTYREYKPKEYKVKFVTDEYVEYELKRLDKDGWEVIHTRRAQGASKYDYGDNVGYEFILMK